MLGLLIINSPIKKRDYKQDMFRAGGLYCVKIVFTLLPEVIIVYM